MPREIIRDFIAVLNLIQQNPGMEFDALVHGATDAPTASAPDRESDIDESAPAASLSPTGAAAPAAQTGSGPAGDAFKAFIL